MNRRFQAEQIYKISNGLESLAEENPKLEKEITRTLQRFEDEMEGTVMGSYVLGCIIDKYSKIYNGYKLP